MTKEYIYDRMFITIEEEAMFIFRLIKILLNVVLIPLWIYMFVMSGVDIFIGEKVDGAVMLGLFFILIILFAINQDDEQEAV